MFSSFPRLAVMRGSDSAYIFLDIRIHGPTDLLAHGSQYPHVHRSTDTYAHRPIDPQPHVPADPQTHTRTAPESHRAWSMEHRQATCTSIAPSTVGTGVEGTRQEQILSPPPAWHPIFLDIVLEHPELGAGELREQAGGEGDRQESGSPTRACFVTLERTQKLPGGGSSSKVGENREASRSRLSWEG